MSPIPIDVPSDDVFETPVVPSGTVVTFNISGVEVTPSKNEDYVGANNLVLTCDVVKADDPKLVGQISITENVCIPSQAYKSAMNNKSWSFVRDRWARLCKVFGIADPTKVEESHFMGKKFIGRFGVEGYKGRLGNVLDEIIKLA